MIGRSSAFLNLVKLIQSISNSNVPVFIEGEIGSGKETAARSIHLHSARKEAPFEVLRCDTTPQEDLEEELNNLSHSFAEDEVLDSEALFGSVQGGTLFLENVDALNPDAQAALLRFLQEQQRRILGGGGIGVKDVRIIASSNRDISGMITSGDFRQDLFYRLSLMKLSVPPLRDRLDDVELLANHFLRACAIRYGSEKSLDESTLEWMAKYNWPGNVGELESLISREYLMGEGAEIHIPSKLDNTDERRKNTDRRSVNITKLSFSTAKDLAIKEFEIRYLDEILTTSEGNVTRAANMAGKERRSLGKLIKKHGIDRRLYTRKSKTEKVQETKSLPNWVPNVITPSAQPVRSLRRTVEVAKYH